MKPSFSVIIPALNEELALPLLLQDLADQSFKNFECLLVDGHSEDQTVKKARIFSNKLNLKILTSKKRNVSTQRNTGAKAAHGEYLLFNDADNRLPSYFLEGIKYNLTSNPVDLFTCWCQPDSNKPADKTITTLINIGIEAANLIDYQAALGALIGCRHSIFPNTGGFDSTIPFAEDGEFIRRSSKKGYKFIIYKNPQFIFSLRRFRSTGKLRSFQRYAKLHLKLLTQKDIKKNEYPMGGRAFISDQETQGLFKKIQEALKSTSKKPKLKEKLKSLINIFENNGS